MPSTPPLTAGPELDAEIAGRVFGLRHVAIMHGGAYELFRAGDGSQDMRLLPKYSTDIAAAWQVVEKVRTWERWQQACFVEEVQDAICSRNDQAYRRINAWGLLMLLEPVDICLAALEALEDHLNEHL